MKDFIKKRLREELDAVLDKINSVGINNLSEIDKLELAVKSNNQQMLKSISLIKMAKELRGDFGNCKVQVNVKPINKQPVEHELSKKNSERVGCIKYYVHHDREDNGTKPYVIVEFPEIMQHSPNPLDTGKDSSPIMLANLEVVGFND